MYHEKRLTVCVAGARAGMKAEVPQETAVISEEFTSRGDRHGAARTAKMMRASSSAEAWRFVVSFMLDHSLLHSGGLTACATGSWAGVDKHNLNAASITSGYTHAEFRITYIRNK
jgi:hypothetical protein